MIKQICGRAAFDAKEQKDSLYARKGDSVTEHQRNEIRAKLSLLAAVLMF
jgi:hypothetical protein